MRTILVDAGPLVAYLDRRDRFHDWAVNAIGGLPPPLLTCDAALSEACFLLRHIAGGPAKVLELLSRDIVRSSFDVSRDTPRIQELLSRYQSVPMSLADACFVRMTELHATSMLLTMDDEFVEVYRRHGRQVIPTLMPPRLRGQKRRGR